MTIRGPWLRDYSRLSRNGIPDSITRIPERLARALDDSYRLEAELGSGAMATVYLAEDVKHRRRVAVKVLRPELAAAIGAERFTREIEIVARLTHPHILMLIDSGEADGHLYYVMPFVDGDTLRDRIEKRQKLGVSESIRIMDQVAERSYEMRDHEIVYMSCLATSEGLRTDPRFQTMLRRIELPLPTGSDRPR